MIQSHYQKTNIHKQSISGQLIVEVLHMIKYRCSKCLQEVTPEANKPKMFCSDPNCGGFIEKVYIDDSEDEEKVERKKLPASEAYTEKLWPVYMNSPIEISAGRTFPSVELWVRRRKEVYIEYRYKFAPEKLNDLNALKRNFESWLHFRNNFSWTMLERSTSNAVDHPQSVAKLLLTLQNEKIEVGARIRSALQGADKVAGIGQGIATALLHTINNEKYGVWNSRTVDTLKKLHRPTFSSDDFGESYRRVNQTLNDLAQETHSDLTTVDGFMWFVSKNYEFQ